ncbi:hypothetical protein [Leuconostoc pseudomesenteroides]|uniref:hypothetical protein n=1 Tax=Leuconostoc pseudomesenteroides TaxID=33968 RepID=UPI0039ED2B8D
MEKETNLDLINKKKQFLIDELGHNKFEQSLTALDELSKKYSLKPYQIIALSEYHRFVTLLPSV